MSVGWAAYRPTVAALPLDAATFEPAAVARFLARLEARDGCLVWTGARNTSGYGAVRLVPGRGWVLAHRAAYALAHGTTPADREIHHRCAVRLCVESSHLEAVTGTENMAAIGGGPFEPALPVEEWGIPI